MIRLLAALALLAGVGPARALRAAPRAAPRAFASLRALSPERRFVRRALTRLRDEMLQSPRGEAAGAARGARYALCLSACASIAEHARASSFVREALQEDALPPRQLSRCLGLAAATAGRAARWEEVLEHLSHAQRRSLPVDAVAALWACAAAATLHDAVRYASARQLLLDAAGERAMAALELPPPPKPDGASAQASKRAKRRRRGAASVGDADGELSARVGRVLAPLEALERRGGEVDLHGLGAEEAKCVLELLLGSACASLPLPRDGAAPLAVITGRGKHSGAEGPTLRPMVLRWCALRGLEATVPEHNPGMVLVALPPPRPDCGGIVRYHDAV